MISSYLAVQSQHFVYSKCPPIGTTESNNTPEVPHAVTFGGTMSFPSSSFVHAIPSAGVTSVLQSNDGSSRVLGSTLFSRIRPASPHRGPHEFLTWNRKNREGSFVVRRFVGRPKPNIFKRHKSGSELAAAAVSHTRHMTKTKNQICLMEKIK